MRLWAVWVFPKIGIPQNGWFMMEKPIFDGWFGGYPYFRKHPCDSVNMMEHVWSMLKHDGNRSKMIQAGWTSVSGRSWGHRKPRRVGGRISLKCHENLRVPYLIRAVFLWEGSHWGWGTLGFSWFLSSCLAPTLIAEVAAVAWRYHKIMWCGDHVWLFRTSMMTKAKMILLQVPRCLRKNEPFELWDKLGHSSGMDFACFPVRKRRKGKEREKGEKREEGEKFETQFESVSILVECMEPGHAEQMPGELYRREEKKKKKDKDDDDSDEEKEKKDACCAPRDRKVITDFPPFCG